MQCGAIEVRWLGNRFSPNCLQVGIVQFSPRPGNSIVLSVLRVLFDGKLLSYECSDGGIFRSVVVLFRFYWGLIYGICAVYLFIVTQQKFTGK